MPNYTCTYDINVGGIKYVNTPWYSQRNKIKKVVIENDVTNIGDYAFCKCSNLTSITIPNSVTSIGESAFLWCSSLTSITIPNSVTSIGKDAFHSSGLTSVNIGNSVTSIGDYAFAACSGLTSVTIPNSVTSIGEKAFEYCIGFISVTIPNSVTSIGNQPLHMCSALTSIIVEEGNEKYDSRNDCNAIIEKESNTLIAGCKNTIIPNSVTSIGDCAFADCSGLTSVIIPNSVTSIGVSAFADCSGLTSVTIPNSVTSIGDYAFLACAGLVSVTIPNSVASIGKKAFNSCSGLTSVTIPNSVASIGDYAFSYCTGLASVTIPNSVTTIGKNAFEGCESLTSISIPNSVANIESGTFYGCSGLTSVTIPNSVTSIRYSVFAYCSSLTSVTIPNSVTSIGNEVFIGCSGLNSITCEASIPPYCQEDCFYDVNKSIPVYVPASSVNAYKKAAVWKKLTNIQAIPSTSLTDGTPYTNNLQLNGRDVSYTRTFNNTSWQALYIPFSLNYADWKDDFEVAYINGVRQLDKDDNGTIDETIMDVIKIKSGSTSPNMPYLIKAKTTGEKTFSVTNATIYPAEENSVDCSTTIAKYTFTGTYNAIPSATMIANGYYAMGGGDLIQSDGSNDLKPYRWYMKVESRNPSYNASNAAKTITINVIDEEGETTTGVEELQMTNCKSQVYDLNGRKVNENNLKSGIYVKNGKKFVVK